jgi:hypothetical protein
MSERLPLVTDVVSADQLHELWGIGYTVVPRSRHPDPFHVPEYMVPATRFYQWFSLEHDKPLFTGTGWAPVPNNRHPGIFAPYGTGGDVQVHGLGLFDKSKAEVDNDGAHSVAAAKKQVEDWASRFGNLSGEVRVGGHAVAELPGPAAAPMKHAFETEGGTIELTQKIPFDMTEHMATIFRERDRLKDALVNPDRTLKSSEAANKFYAAIEADPSLPWWPTLHAILLPIAIENVRAKLKESEETTS